MTKLREYPTRLAAVGSQAGFASLLVATFALPLGYTCFRSSRAPAEARTMVHVQARAAQLGLHATTTRGDGAPDPNGVILSREPMTVAAGQLLVVGNRRSVLWLGRVLVRRGGRAFAVEMQADPHGIAMLDDCWICGDPNLIAELTK